MRGATLRKVGYISPPVEGLPVRQQAAVDQAGDARVLQPRQQRALALEALHREPAVAGGAAQQLERNALHEIVLLALGQVDHAHAAVADPLQHPVTTRGVHLQVLAGQFGRFGQLPARRMQRGLRGHRAPHPGHLGQQLGITGALARDEVRPLVRRQLVGGRHDFLAPQVAGMPVVHVVPPTPLASAPSLRPGHRRGRKTDFGSTARRFRARTGHAAPVMIPRRDSVLIRNVIRCRGGAAGAGECRHAPVHGG